MSRARWCTSCGADLRRALRLRAGTWCGSCRTWVAVVDHIEDGSGPVGIVEWCAIHGGRLDRRGRCQAGGGSTSVGPGSVCRARSGSGLL